jgi:hypothetical protein
MCLGCRGIVPAPINNDSGITLCMFYPLPWDGRDRINPLYREVIVGCMNVNYGSQYSMLLRVHVLQYETC